MSIRVEESKAVECPHDIGKCSICSKRKAEVDMEVINKRANEVMSLQACIICATDLAARAGKALQVDTDQLLYVTLGTITSCN